MDAFVLRVNAASVRIFASTSARRAGAARPRSRQTVSSVAYEARSTSPRVTAQRLFPVDFRIAALSQTPALDRVIGSARIDGATRT